jgi:hypothetical protein
MGLVLFQAAKIVVYGTAAACAILLVGGAIKKVITDPGDECIGSGKEIARSMIGAASLKIGDTRATAVLTEART